MPVYDESDPPRIVVSFTASEIDDGICDVVRQYAGAVHTHANVSGRGPSLRWESWDAVISFGDVPWLGASSDHLRLLQFGGTPTGGIRKENSTRSFSQVHTYGEEVEIPSSLDSQLKELVKSTILPRVRASAVPRGTVRPFDWGSDTSETTVLTQDLDGRWHSAIYNPDAGPAEIIYLPCFEVDFEYVRLWLLYALERWSKLDPARFPPGPDWTSDERWMMRSEQNLARKIDEIADELAEATNRLEGQIADAKSELEKMQARVDEGERLILSGTGAPLVVAVAATLERLGFDVENRDLSEGREKLEDLRVRTANDSDGWIALAEIKGYSKGGSPTDLQKLGRFVERYILEAKEAPNARWYIVNQFKDRNPANRPQLLRGQDPDVDLLAEDGGLAIDTRDLFRLGRDVDGGSIAAPDARALLISATGRFCYSSAERPQ
ncbi:hypothetical protein [Nocardia sp. 348MFTsu5.1]|uniref:hypothetical protein n=1 Tax=Nocardia sp. 348MFTsu5.1 TaxID=1172185 RepID=UPI0012DEF6F7|nr:hypothetical protein [Nocardia sp. 348MFTsu5.1]